MLIHRHLPHNLSVERHRTLGTAYARQYSVIVPPSPPQPPPPPIKSHARNQNQPQGVYDDRSAMVVGLANPKMARAQIRGGVPNVANNIAPRDCVEARQPHFLPSRQRDRNQRPNIQFRWQGRVEQNGLRLVPKRLGHKELSGLCRAGRSLLGRHSFQLASQPISERLLRVWGIEVHRLARGGRPRSQAPVPALRVPGSESRGFDFANSARHFSTRSLIFFSTPCSVGS